MLNFILGQRQLGNAKINQILNQEEGCTIEELLLEEDKLVQLCRGGSIPKLIEFICQRSTLQKLIQYSVQHPRNPNNHDQTYKFPFVAADVLASNAMILQALIEGGWNNDKEEEEEEEKDKNDEADDLGSLEHPMTQSILNTKPEQEMVQSALDSQNKEDAKENKVQQLVEELDQDLELDADAEADAENDGDDKEKSDKPTITQVGLKENIANTGAAAKTEGGDDDDEVQLEDPSEDVKDEGEEGDKKTGEANESTETKLAGALDNEATAEATEATVEPEMPKKDYSLLDNVMSFLFEDEDPESILCGYFLKVMEQLLEKQKQMTLEYLLLHQEGKVFNGLLRHLDQHSLATLLIKLIEQQIQPEKKDKWDASDNSDLDIIEQEPNEPELTPAQKKMQQVLKEKSVMVVNSLLDKISYRNKDDLHMALNASAVLVDFCENENFFQILTQPDVMQKIVQVVCCTDENAQNQHYALNFLTQMINQFSEQDSSFFKDRKEEALDNLMDNFSDLCYNCMMILRGGETLYYTNQSQREVRKTGMLRIRAMEQLRALFTVLSKRGPINQQACLGEILRKKIIETMLYMMRTFQFCSISHQQGLLILNLIREAYDDEDLETMKNFVREELEADTNFHYPSGKVTSRMNLGQIIKIALELRQHTEAALNDMDSSDDEDPIQKRSGMQSWFHFCSETVAGIERTWNRKLEQPDMPVEPTPVEPETSLDDHDKTIEDMFARFNQKKRPNTDYRKPASEAAADLLMDIQASQKENAQDDTFNKKTTDYEYSDNQFWKAPDMYDIDELLAEQDKGS